MPPPFPMPSIHNATRRTGPFDDGRTDAGPHGVPSPAKALDARLSDLEAKLRALEAKVEAKK